MSLRVQPIPPIPDDTAHLVRQLLPADHPLVLMGDRWSSFVTDADFADLYGAEGRPALSPAVLALVTLLQGWEFLSDRRAAQMVITRVDWKYALHLGLTYAGFDHSVLCEFRQRLLRHQAEARVFEKLLQALRAAGLLTGQHLQRTDSLAILAAVRQLSRLELARETLRLALEELATADPAWVRQTLPAEWVEQYSAWAQHERLVHHKGEAGRREAEALLAETGQAGQWLLVQLAAPTTPPTHAAGPRVGQLQQVWQAQFELVGDTVQPRAHVDTCAAPPLLTPHDPESRYGEHGGRGWEGYTLHVTETADPAAPRLITDVHTTPANVPDCQQVAAVHDRMAARELLPATHLCDRGYVTGAALASSQARGVDLVGPVRANTSAQARRPDGLSAAQFQVDFDQRQAVCPAGHHHQTWSEAHPATAPPSVNIHFAAADCAACPLRARCLAASASQASGRSLKLPLTYPLIVRRREEQTTPAFRDRYRRRAGVEASLSNAVHQHGARFARYRGLAKTRLQHFFLASAINLKRAVAWSTGQRPRTERRARLPVLLAATG